MGPELIEFSWYEYHQEPEVFSLFWKSKLTLLVLAELDKWIDTICETIEDWPQTWIQL